MMSIDDVIRMAETNNGYCGEDGIRYLRWYRQLVENLSNIMDARYKAAMEQARTEMER